MEAHCEILCNVPEFPIGGLKAPPDTSFMQSFMSQKGRIKKSEQKRHRSRNKYQSLPHKNCITFKRKNTLHEWKKSDIEFS